MSPEIIPSIYFLAVTFSLMNRPVFGFAQVHLMSLHFGSLTGLVLSAQTLLVFSLIWRWLANLNRFNSFPSCYFLQVFSAYPI